VGENPSGYSDGTCVSFYQGLNKTFETRIAATSFSFLPMRLMRAAAQKSHQPKRAEENKKTGRPPQRSPRLETFSWTDPMCRVSCVPVRAIAP